MGPLWILVSFSRGDYFLFRYFPHVTLFSRNIATIRLSCLGAVNPKSSPSTAQELQSRSLGHTEGTRGQLWPRCRAEGQQEAQQKAVLRPLCSARYRQQEMCVTQHGLSAPQTTDKPTWKTPRWWDSWTINTTHGAFVGQLSYSRLFLQAMDGESCLCAL